METFQPYTITLSGKEAVSSGLLRLQPLQKQRNQHLKISIFSPSLGPIPQTPPLSPTMPHPAISPPTSTHTK